MRNFFNGLFLVALMSSSHLAAAANPPSLSGTTIPSAAQIIDAGLNTWTLSGGQAYENGKPTPSSGVILLLCYGGTVYQENIHHNWWLWDPNTDILSWVASSDPRVISPSGTTIPTATQIIDSELHVWTLSGGQAYEKGQLTPSSGVILLLYAKGIVYQENIHHNWWLWRNGAWVATSAPHLPSASGTTIPTATQIVDNELNVWTVSGGQAYENHALTPSSGVTLLLFYGGNVYQENVHHNWWQWNGQAWISTASDPRAGHPLAYVASATKAADGTYHNSVTVIDTGTNRVTDTISMGWGAHVVALYLAVTPDAKHVYAAGFWNTTFGSVAVIDTAQKSVVTSIRVPYYPQGIVASPDGTRVYVISSAGGSTVSAIDTATNVVVATIHIPGGVVGVASIAISPDGKRLYVPSTSGVVAVIDTATNRLVSQFTIPDPYNPSETFYTAAVSPDNAKLYTNAYYYPPRPAFGDVIAVFDPATGGVTTTIPNVMDVGVFSPDSQHLYGLGLGGVAVIDTATDAPTTAVANIPDADDLAITPDGKHLYITDVSTSSVMVADTATYTISTILPVLVAGKGAIAIVSAH
jgi:YVTN family beta-propeller protein